MEKFAVKYPQQCNTETGVTDDGEKGGRIDGLVLFNSKEISLPL